MRLSAEQRARGAARARLSLLGLSVGDAFGEQYFGLPEDVVPLIQQRRLKPGPWRWTDDTAMACSVVACLDALGWIDPSTLAGYFARAYQAEPGRGYGSGAHQILAGLRLGISWNRLAQEAFGGRGSCGNGAAGRVAPLGAYFCEDVERVAREARNSAVVTHAHPEGQAGAVAVACAAAWAASRDAHSLDSSSGPELLRWTWAHTPPGATREGLSVALDLPLEREPEEAAALLGNGSEVTSQDTVPYCVWCAARHLDSYPEAMWTTLRGLGDRDTTCAIVGGIVALCCRPGVPAEWLAAREPLPAGLERLQTHP